MNKLTGLAVFFSGVILIGCDTDSQHPVNDHAVEDAIKEPVSNPGLPGGTASVRNTGRNAFSMPSANLPPSRKVDFSVGNSFFRNPWVAAPASTTARDGLGPVFNINACQGCHIKDGRGHPPPADHSNAFSTLVRLSIPAHQVANAEQRSEMLMTEGLIPEPVYGGQLQDMAIPGVPAEGKVQMTYTEQIVQLADGVEVALRKPQLEITALAYGPMHPEVMTSVRVAPPMIGLGLLEAIAEADIVGLEDVDDANQDGISGRVNRVWDRVNQQTTLGRFGWKAGQPNLNQQNAAAFAGDLGLTSSIVLADDCTESQLPCKQAVDGNEPEGYEVSDNILDKVLFYTRNLAVPVRRNMNDPQVVRGEEIFHQSECAACHRPSFSTSAEASEPELASQIIYPYTDLLLHDMGEGLADHRPEFLASGSEWRTPPLWGIGLTEQVSGHTYFLHDGRARNLLEAILWHGGEAESSRQAVINLTTDDRTALLKFVESL